MTDQIPDAIGEPLDIEATGEITDGKISITVKLGAARIDVILDDNEDETFEALDTLHQVLPAALAQVVERLVEAQEADRG